MDLRATAYGTWLAGIAATPASRRLLALLPHRGGALVAGSVVAQAVALAAMPLLTLLYSPRDFGLAAAFTSLQTLLVPLLAFRLELAIPLVRTDKNASALLLLTLASTVVIGSALGSLVWTYSVEMAWLLGAPDLAALFSILPATLMTAGAHAVLLQWSIRGRDYTRLGRCKFWQGIGQATAQFSLGLFHIGPVGLLSGIVFGQVLSAKTLARPCRRRSLPVFCWNTWKRAWLLAFRYRRFVFFSNPSILFNAAGLHCPVLLLSAYYGPATVGALAISTMILVAPWGFLGNAYSQSYLAEASRLARQDRTALCGLLLETSSKLLRIGLPLFGVLLLLGPLAIRLVFGPDWSLVQTFLPILAPLYLLQLLVVPIEHTLVVLERQHNILFWDAVRLAGVCGGLVFCGSRGLPSWQALACYSLVMCLAYCAKFLTCLRAAQRLRGEQS